MGLLDYDGGMHSIMRKYLKTTEMKQNSKVVTSAYVPNYRIFNLIHIALVVNI